MKTKPTYVYVTYIATTPAALWKALTTTDLISQYWLGRMNISSWKKGSILESRDPDGELEWHGKILESKRPNRLVYTFDVVGRKEGPSRVAFDIEKHSAKVLKLTVTHDKFPDRSKIFQGIQLGWPKILSNLKSLLETGQAITFASKD